MDRIRDVRGRQSLTSFIVSNIAFLMCLILVLYNCMFRPNFLRLNTIWNIFSQTVSLVFCAMGMTIVISAGCTDLSISAMMAVGSSICGTMIIGGSSAVLSILVALVICAVLGVVNGLMVTKLKIQPMVAMLISRMVYRAGINIFTKGIAMNLPTNAVANAIGRGRITGLRMPIIIIPMVLIVLLTLFIVRKTTFGKRIEAVGNNQRTAYLCGVSVTLTILGAYVLSACFAGFGGILDLFRSNALDSNTVGIDFEMTSIAAATIGGTSMRGGKAKVMGTVFGALLMTLITMTVNFANMPFEFNNVFKAIVIIFAIAIQQTSKNS